MTDRENQGETFLRRWSRLKQAAESPARDDSAQPLREISDAEPDALAPPMAQSGSDLSAFDPASLPPIELISASSDIRAFLAPGVPDEVKRAALRRAWITDPAIRDFVGVAESQWDFNKPGGVPGFGSLEELTPELCRMVAGLFSDPPAEKASPRLAEVHDISPEPPPQAAPRASAPETGPAPGQVEVVAVPLPEYRDDEPVQPIHASQKSA